MQRIESRKWNCATESFQDYAMDKLTLMRCLKLEDPDSIQFLINGINNLSIKCVAAGLRVNSLNQFLRKMQHITSACADSLKRFQPFNKFEKSKDSIQSLTNPRRQIFRRKKPIFIRRISRQIHIACIVTARTT